MPIAPAIIAALIGAGVSGTTLGLEASGAIGGGSGPSQADQQKQLQQQQEAQQKQQQQQEQQLFKHFAPDAQAQTGGALADQSFASMVASLTGAPGDINLAQQTLFGNGPAQTDQPLPQTQGGLSTTSVGG
jgi:hypothetical protein